MTGLNQKQRLVKHAPRGMQVDLAELNAKFYWFTQSAQTLRLDCVRLQKSTLRATERGHVDQFSMIDFQTQFYEAK